MKLLSVTFEGFRNLDNTQIHPCEGVNVIYGENAQGKTNLIEAIWLLTGNKSFRGSLDKEMIGFDREFARIKASFFSQGREQTAELVFMHGKKEAYLNGVKLTGASALYGNLFAVVFSPEHLSLVKNGPSERRKFIDSAICQIKPSYRDMILMYNKTITQRNALLRDLPTNPGLYDTLSAWDERLASVGMGITVVRNKYIKMLHKRASHYHEGISYGREKLSIEYSSAVDGLDDKTDEQVRADLYALLKSKRREDTTYFTTSCGPHRDDIEILINGEPARKFGSQGQQRSCVLSMKIAEEELVKLASDEEPVVLLDDVLSELDPQRQKFLLNEIGDRQVFITCCESASATRLDGGKLFYVENGGISEKNGETQNDKVG